MSEIADPQDLARKFGRRHMLGMTTAAVAMPMLGAIFPAGAGNSSQPDLHFSALYQGSPVGEHRVAFKSDGERLIVTTHIEITIKVLFFTAFHFAHDAIEIWHAGRLHSVESTTDDNGTRLAVTGAAASDGFRIIGVDGPFLAAPQLLTTNTLWNSRLLRESRMIDIQYGGEVGLVVKPLGAEQILTPRGPVAALRYQIITPNYAGSLFFDADGQWVKSLMERQGEILEYELLS
ncbi:MAG: DUF6134 family protein [Rhodospirillales bacterium]